MDTSSGASQERVQVVAASNGLLEVTVPNQPELVAVVNHLPGGNFRKVLNAALAW